MDKLKSFIKKPGVVVCVIAALCIMFSAIISEATAVRIDDIEGYEDILTDVEKLQFYHNSNNFFTTLSPAKKLREIKRVKIKSEPVSEDRSADRDSEYRIIITDKDEHKYVISVSGDFTEMWIDDIDTIKINLDESGIEKETDENRTASFTYSVRNPKTLKSFFPEDE